MILPDVREAAIEQVERALREEVGDDALLRERAENLVAIAIAEDIDIDDLIKWIHYRVPEKEWSTEEFRGWAWKLQETVAALVAMNDETSTRICPECFSHVAQRMKNGVWWCPCCGMLP